MSIPAAGLQVLDFFGTRVLIEPLPGQLSSDTGLLPIRPFDQRIGLIWAFAEAQDVRDPVCKRRTPSFPGPKAQGLGHIPRSHG
jgi:hypothetical protein